FFYNVNKKKGIPPEIIRKHPIFFRLLELGINFLEKDHDNIDDIGFHIINGIAGAYALNIFIGKLLSEKKIDTSLVDSILKRTRMRIRLSAPQNSSELQTWLNQPQIKCLISYWFEPNWSKLRANNELLNKVIGGECNQIN
ncbi:MAG TPA: hypothetical protein VF571_00835, partial [Pyrinomonadaceae bacterium]